MQMANAVPEGFGANGWVGESHRRYYIGSQKCPGQIVSKLCGKFYGKMEGADKLPECSGHG